MVSGRVILLQAKAWARRAHRNESRSLRRNPSPSPQKTTGTVRCDVEKDAFVAHYRQLQASYDQRVAASDGAAQQQQQQGERWRPPPAAGDDRPRR
jgi:hypothetical protein